MNWRKIFAFCVAICVAYASLTFPSLAFYRVPNSECVFTHAPTGERVIALTFDDGPHPRYTPAILKLLDEYGICATFFQIGQNVRYYPDAARAVAQAGHEIGNHTDSHTCLRGMSLDCLLNEYDEAAKQIRETTGTSPALFRPPQGICGQTVKDLAKRRDTTVVLWTIDTLDWKSTPSDVIVQNVVDNVEPGDIILMHDYVSGKNTTIDALKKMIPRLIDEGYSFVTVSELIQFSQ